MDIPPEGPEDEWKELLPAPERVARTLSAFSNGTGGRLWVGLTDAGLVRGVQDPARVREVLDLALALVQPAPRVQVHALEAGTGRTLVRIDVAPGTQGTAWVEDGRRPRTAYLRDRDRTRPLEPAAVRDLEREGASLQLEAKDRRLLELLKRYDGLEVKELARRARMGERDVRRRLVRCRLGGLVQEQPDGRHALTPRGYRRV